MYATVYKPGDGTIPKVWGPFHNLSAAMEVMVPKTGQADVYDLDLPLPEPDWFVKAGIIFSSGRKHVKEEYRGEYDRQTLAGSY